MNAAPVGGASSQRSDHATLLVVEDEVLIRHSVCEALRYHAYTVLEASSASEALTILSSVPVDLVFVDLHMPGQGDGFSVARFVRSQLPEIPIILTSGKIRGSIMDEVEEFGPFIPKPYLISRVLRLIREGLEPDREL